MEDIREVLNTVSGFSERTAFVVDENCYIYASTDPAMEGNSFKDAGDIFGSGSMGGVAGDCSYRMLDNYGGNALLLMVEGQDQTSELLLELLSGWLNTVLRHSTNDEDKRDFLKNVMIENELPGDIPLKAREYKIPYSSLRTCYLLRSDGGANTERAQLLRSLFPNRSADFIITMDENNIALIKELHPDEIDRIEVPAKLILEAADTSENNLVLGIGMPFENLKDLPKSYREASLSLTIGEIFEEKKQIIRYDKLGLGRLIYQLPPTLCRMFLEEVFPDRCFEEIDNETLKTIEKFFENNLNGSETSRQLFVHRNTLVYRLDKVQKITGLDLRNFDDAVLFKLAEMVRKQLMKQREEQGGRSGFRRTLV